MTKVDDIPHGTSSGYAKHKCRCDECREYKAQKARERYAEKAEQIRAANLAWYYRNREKAIADAVARHRANPDKARAATARWKAAHPDRVKELTAIQNARPETRQRHRGWVKANRTQVNEAAARWRSKPESKEKVRLAAKRRRALIRQADVRKISVDDWRRLIQRQHRECFYCGSPSDPLTADHVIPLSRGGRHAIGNIVAACKSCNSSKHDHLLVEWLGIKRSLS